MFLAASLQQVVVAAQPKGLPVDGIAAVVGDQVVLVSEVLAAVTDSLTPSTNLKGG